MATDTIPEPLTNQDLRQETGVDLSRPELPPAEPDANTRLREVAAQTGHAAGKAVAAVREMPRRESGEPSTVEEIKNRVSDAAEQARDRVAETYDKTKQQAAETYRQTRERLSGAAERARVRSRRIIDEYPLHVIAGAAAVGFVIGVLMRVWRSSRYE